MDQLISQPKDRFMAEAHTLAGEVNELRREAAIPKTPEAVKFFELSTQVSQPVKCISHLSVSCQQSSQQPQWRQGRRWTRH